MEQEEVLSVAETRKGFRDVLNRAFYNKKTTTVENREKPVAEINPVGGRKALDGQKRLAEALGISEEDVFDLLTEAFEDEETKSLILQKKCSDINPKDDDLAA